MTNPTASDSGSAGSLGITTINRVNWGGYSARHLPADPTVTRFYEARNGMVLNGRLIKAPGSTSVANYFDTNARRRPAYIGDIETATSFAQYDGYTAGVPVDFAPVCGVVWGGLIYLGGSNGASVAQIGTVNAALPTNVVEVVSFALSGASCLQVRCFGGFNGRLYASGAAGSSGYCRLAVLDNDTGLWNFISGVNVTDGDCGQLVAFGDRLYAATTKGVFSTDDPSVPGSWRKETPDAESVHGGCAVCIQPDETNGAAALWAAGETLWRLDWCGSEWLTVIDLGLARIEQCQQGTMIWYVNGLFWIAANSQAGGSEVDRFFPGLDASVTTTSLRRAVTLSTWRRDLFALTVANGNLRQWRRATRYDPSLLFDWAAGPITNSADIELYQSLASDEAMYYIGIHNAGGSINAVIGTRIPYRPLALSPSTADGLPEAWCLDALTSTVRVMKNMPAAPYYQQVYQVAAAGQGAPQINTTGYAGRTIAASNLFELQIEYGGQFGPLTVPVDPAFTTELANKALALPYVPRPLYVISSGTGASGSVIALNLSQDPNETDVVPEERACAVRWSVPLGASVYNTGVVYGPGQIWLTESVSNIEAVNGRYITGGAAYRGVPYIFTNDAVWALNNLDTTQSGGGIVLVDSQYGCESHQSIVSANNLLYLMTRDGPAKFDGQRVMLLQGTLRANDVIVGKLGSSVARTVSNLSNSHGVYIPWLRQVWWWVYGPAAEVPDTVLAVNVDTEELFMFNPATVTFGSERGLMATCSATLNPSAQNAVYLGSPAGNILTVGQNSDNDQHPIDLSMRTLALAAKEPGYVVRLFSAWVRYQVGSVESPPTTFKVSPVMRRKVVENVHPLDVQYDSPQVQSLGAEITPGEFVSQALAFLNGYVEGPEVSVQFDQRGETPVVIVATNEQYETVMHQSPGASGQ